MDRAQPKPSAATQYMNLIMGWGLKGISYITTTPEALKKTGSAGVNLLEGFHISDRHVAGEVEAAKVRDVVKQAMDPIKSFFRAGLVLTAALFFASRVVSIFPIVPSILLLLSGISAIITWDIHSALREMNHTYTHFNRIHLQGMNYQPPEERESLAKVGHPTVTFEQFVEIIDSYSQQILSNTWIISGFDPVEHSLTNWRPLLTELVQNQTEETGVSPWVTAQKFFPFLPLICRVAEAADKQF